MKRLLLWIVILLAAWTAYQQTAVREALNRGPGALITQLRNWAQNYNPDALETRLSASLRITTRVRDYLNTINHSRREMEDFAYNYCDRDDADHPVLSHDELVQVCDAVDAELNR